MEKPMQNFQTIRCRNCQRQICESDGEEVCFIFAGNRVCVGIRGEYEKVKCGCKKITKVRKNLGLGK
jgi:hypothetical protein